MTGWGVRAQQRETEAGLARLRPRGRTAHTCQAAALLPVCRGRRGGPWWSRHWGRGGRRLGPPRPVTCLRAAGAGPQPLRGCPHSHQPSLPDGARHWAWRAGRWSVNWRPHADSPEAAAFQHLARPGQAACDRQLSPSLPQDTRTSLLTGPSTWRPPQTTSLLRAL